MNPINPRFGSIYMLKEPKMLECCHSPQEFGRIKRGIQQATDRLDRKGPVKIIRLVSASQSSLGYPVTLPSGEQRIVQMQCNESHGALHILSGVDQSKPDSTVNRDLPMSPMARLQNWWRNTIQKRPPLTVEERSDRQVEALLNRYHVPFEKRSFENAGRVERF